MPLFCVCGRSGSGKSRAIAKAMENAISEGRQAFLIVPDQFTLDAEHLLMEHLGSNGLLSAEVLSFSRLCARVLEQCGQPNGSMLDARGRAMMVSRVLLENENSLCAYGKYVHSPHFSSTLSGQIAEFKRFDIKAEQLLQLSLEQPRLHDIGLLYQAYQKAISGIYTDNEDRINFMIERIPQAPFLQGASIFIDEFEMLTSQIYRTVQALLQTAHEVFATFRLCDNGDADEPIFALEQKHLHKMKALAADLGHPAEMIRLHSSKQDPQKAPALIHLERSLFVQPPPPYTGNYIDGISLFTATSMRQEAFECARRIFTLVRDEEYRFSDIAVVTSDLSDYGPLLQQAFSTFDIPSFLDVKRSVGTHPLARYGLLSLRVLLSNFATRDVIALIKTGLSCLSVQESDLLEELITTSGIRFFSQSSMARYAQAHPQLPAFRALLFASHDALYERFQKAESASAQAQAYMQFLEEDGCVQRCNSLLHALESEGDADGAMELSQVFSALCSILSQLHTVMGTSRLSLRSFYDELHAGLFAEEVGVLPSVRDAVQVGTVGRSRSGSLRALFVLGMNEGSIPRSIPEDGLLTHEDQHLLQGASLFMGNSLRERAIEERMTLYALFTKPTSRLTLSFSQCNLGGGQLLESSLLHPLRQCFPALKLETCESSPVIDIQTPLSTLLPLADRIRTSRLTHTPLDPAYAFALDHLLPALPETTQSWFLDIPPMEEDIGEELAQAVYQQVQSGSATSLEQLAQCPFRHFAAYALLQPPPKQPYGHNSMDTGKYFHDIADEYLQRLISLKSPLSDFDRQQSDALLDELCGAHDEKEFLIGPYRQDGRERHLAHWHRQRLKNDCWQLKKQLQSDSFHPVEQESSFERSISLKDGQTVTVRGRIDRVDLAVRDGKRLVRVVDYKTGTKSFSYTDLFYGTSLQLPLYADIAAKKLNGQSVGMFMQHLGQSVGLCAPKDAEKEREKAVKLNGTFTKDCVDAVGPYSSDLLVGPDAKNRLLSDEEYQSVLRLGIDRAQELMLSKLMGQSRANPLKGAIDACEYCDFSAVCGFDPLRGHGRRCVPLKRDAFLSLISKEGEENT